MANEIINRIEKSPIVQIDLEDYYTAGPRKSIDIKDWLYMELILREKDFREMIKLHDWAQYENCFVSIYCSADAIIPQWASMLIASALEPYAKMTNFGDSEQMEILLYEDAFRYFNFDELKGKPVIIKGCGNLPVPTHAYLSFTQKAQAFAKSIMYGEACSTVPVYKRK